MTVPIDVAFSGPYYTNGAATDFPFEFKANSETDVSVIRVAPAGSATIVSPALYSVSLAPNDGPGGTVQFLVAPVTSDEELFVALTPSFEQNIKYEDEGAFNQSILNRMMDEAALRSIFLRHRIDRSLSLPFGEEAAPLPSREARKGKFLGFSTVDGAPVATDGSDTTLAPDLASGDAGKGSALVAHKAPGDGALVRTTDLALNDFPNIAGYPSVAAAIAAAVAGDFVVGVGADILVNIPSDAATMQIAVDRLVPLNRKCRIDLKFEAGHAIATRLILSRRSCKQFRITSVDALVPLAVGYSGSIFTGYYADFPEVLCKFNAANQVAGSGASLDGGSITFAPGSGIINTWGGGLATRYGAVVIHDGADFSGGARNAVTGSGLTVWGGIGSGEGMNVADSDYYGAQVAHGGCAGFGSSNASYAIRYGFRATDGAVMDVDKCTAINCGQEAVRCFNATLVNGPGFQGSGAGANGVSISGASSGNFPSDGTNSADFTAAGIYGAFVANASCANLVDSKLWSAGTNGARIANGSLAYAGGANGRRNGQSGADSAFDFTVAVGSLLALNGTTLGGISQQPNFLGPEGIIFDPRPYTVAEFTLGANTDNYDLSPSIRDVIIVTPDNTRNITGLAQGQSGRRITIQNGSSTNRIQIKHEDAGSNSSSRFNLPGAQQVFIYPGCAATFVYINSRWRLQSITGPQQLFTYTVATLPSAATFTNAIVYVSNAAGGAIQAFSDGTNWRRVDDRAVVS